jgi:hypothetical protein
MLSVALGHPAQCGFCMQKESLGMSFLSFEAKVSFFTENKTLSFHIYPPGGIYVGQTAFSFHAFFYLS